MEICSSSPWDSRTLFDPHASIHFQRCSFTFAVSFSRISQQKFTYCYRNPWILCLLHQKEEVKKVIGVNLTWALEDKLWRESWFWFSLQTLCHFAKLQWARAVKWCRAWPPSAWVNVTAACLPYACLHDTRLGLKALR